MTIAVGAGLDTSPDPVEAADRASAAARSSAGEGPLDLAMVFFSATHLDAAAEIGSRVRQSLGAKALIGCSAQGVLGGRREVEQGPAVAVWAARFPGTQLMTFWSDFDPELKRVTGFPQSGSSMIVLADPYSFPADSLLRALNEERPGLAVVGGLASAAAGPGENRLIVDDDVRSAGAAGVVLEGAVGIEPLVSQGCRPIGDPMTVTRADRNIILELGGRTPLERIREAFSAASAEERALMQRGLLIGRVVDEYKSEYRRGDFLIRVVMGADPETGAIAVGDGIEIGETIQFHVRDAASADEDLRTMLEGVDSRPAGALLFTCNGRGMHLFSEPDHDARAVQSALGDLPLAGFFAAGELGPIGGKNFVHGYTASMALFVEE